MSYSLSSTKKNENERFRDGSGEPESKECGLEAHGDKALRVDGKIQDGDIKTRKREISIHSTNFATRRHCKG